MQMYDIDGKRSKSDDHDTDGKASAKLIDAEAS